jgi:hypothetical protein
MKIRFNFAALTQPPIEDAEVRVVCVLKNLRFHPLRKRPHDVAVAPDALGFGDKSGLHANVSLDISQGVDQLIKRSAELISGFKHVGRRR